MGAAKSIVEAEPEGAQVTDEDIQKAAKIIAGGKVVVFTGAGVSAESGVPTYRDPGGLWKKFDMKKVSHIKCFYKDPIACWRFELELFRLLQNVAPNPGHYALAALEADGLVTGVVTQNVEGLHQASGSKNVVELHGNETRALCLQCGQTCSALVAFRGLGWVDDGGNIQEQNLPDVSMILASEKPEGPPLRSRSSSSSSSSSSSGPPSPASTAEAKVVSGSSSSGSSRSGSPKPRKPPPVQKGQPSCPSCGDGLLKPDAIYFGEKLDTKVLRSAERLFNHNEVALIVGSSCRVAPASVLPLILRKNGGKLLEVNPQASRLSSFADVRLRGSSATLLPRLREAVAALRAAQPHPPPKLAGPDVSTTIGSSGPSVEGAS